MDDSLMKYLLEPSVRLMNRLRYSYKFGLIGLLIFLQAFVLIYMLVSELNKNIDFAARERAGVQYIRALTHLLNATQEYRSIHYAFSKGDRSLQEALFTQQTQIDAALDAVESIDAQSQMETTWKLQMLRNDWHVRKQDALNFEPERSQVAFDLDSRFFNEVTDMMQHVGYASNLALDSDFDTSYLIDSVLRKLPGLLETLSAARGLSIQLQDEKLSTDGKYRLLQVIGLVQSNLELADHNAQLVFRHNDFVKSRLKSLHTALTDAVPIFVWNFEQKTIGQQGLPIPQQLLTAAGNQAIQAASELHMEGLTVIDQLLVERIDRYSQYRNLVVLFTGSILMLVSYLFFGFDISVRRAVCQLDDVMTSAGNGNLNVRGNISACDEMGSLAQSINNTLDSLQSMMEEVQSSHTKLEAWNLELEKKIAERTASLRNLLDHAGQGFFSFGEDLCVRGEYSAECSVIFGRDIAGESVPALIYPDDRDQQKFLEAIFRKILQEEHAFLRETYFSLLPEELIFSGSYIGISYKLIEKVTVLSQREIMLVLTDLTLQKSMEVRVQAERNVLSMIVQVVTHSVDFFGAISQYTSFCREGMRNLLTEKKRPGELLATLFRTVHTFKGTFGQFRMGHAMAKLHEMEGMLDIIRASKTTGEEAPFLAERLRDFTPEVMLGWLDPDLEILKDKLGEAFFQRKNMLVVDNNRLLEIEEKVLRMLSPGECSLLLPDLRRLRYKPIKELLQIYPEYVVALAEQNEKAVHSFEIEGGDTMVDPRQYYDFIKSLVHVFRNSIAHGLEPYEERVAIGKDERGTIICAVTENEAGVTIVISDDGRGISPAHILDVALKKNLCTPEVAGSMGEEDIVQLIFADGFSGVQDGDALAGRGVGLSAVRAELEKLNGSVQVNTVWGKGTQFQFFLPYANTDEKEFYSILQLAKPLLDAIQVILLNDADLQTVNLTYIESAAGGKLSLRKVTIFLGIKGLVKGRMVLSADQAVVEHMIAKRFVTGVVDVTIDRMLETALSQYANEIFQQALRAMPGWAEFVTTEALVSILAEEASAKYPQSETPMWVMDTEVGKIALSLVY